MGTFFKGFFSTEQFALGWRFFWRFYLLLYVPFALLFPIVATASQQLLDATITSKNMAVVTLFPFVLFVVSLFAFPFILNRTQRGLPADRRYAYYGFFSGQTLRLGVRSALWFAVAYLFLHIPFFIFHILMSAVVGFYRGLTDRAGWGEESAVTAAYFLTCLISIFVCGAIARQLIRREIRR